MEKNGKVFEQPIMDQDYFDSLTDRFRSPHLWRWDGSRWTLRHKIYKEVFGKGDDYENSALDWRGNRYQDLIWEESGLNQWILVMDDHSEFNRNITQYCDELIESSKEDVLQS